MSNARAARRRSTRNNQGPLPDIGLYFNGAMFIDGNDVKRHMERILDLMARLPVLRQGGLTIREHLVLEESPSLEVIFPDGQPISLEFSTRVTPQQRRCVMVSVDQYVSTLQKIMVEIVEKMEEGATQETPAQENHDHSQASDTDQSSDSLP